MTVEIRPAEPADMEAIQAVARAAWEEAHTPIIGQSAVERFLDEHYNRETLQERLEAETVFLSAVDDRTVVGFAVAGPSEGDSSSFILGRLYVNPDRWGEGIGRRLLERVEVRTRQRGAERLRLGVMAENERAVGFYEAAGYQRIGVHEDECIGTTAYEYEKEL